MDDNRVLECNLVIGDTNRIYIVESDTGHSSLASYLQNILAFENIDNRRTRSPRLKILVEEIDG